MRTLQLGQTATEKRTFISADVIEYGNLAGILPLDPGLVPPPLLGGMFSHLLGTRLPGPGTNYLKQRLEFRGTAKVGDQIEARVEIVRLRPEKNLVNLRTVCLDPDGRIVCEGEALVLASYLEA